MNNMTSFIYIYIVHVLIKFSCKNFTKFMSFSLNIKIQQHHCINTHFIHLVSKYLILEFHNKHSDIKVTYLLIA